MQLSFLIFSTWNLKLTLYASIFFIVLGGYILVDWQLSYYTSTRNKIKKIFFNFIYHFCLNWYIDNWMIWAFIRIIKFKVYLDTWHYHLKMHLYNSFQLFTLFHWRKKPSAPYDQVGPSTTDIGEPRNMSFKFSGLH